MRAAIEFLTRDEPPSALEVQQFIRECAAGEADSVEALDAAMAASAYITDGSPQIDPFVRAALLQRFAHAVLESHAHAASGRRVQRFTPMQALTAIDQALGIIDEETSYGYEPLPAEVWVELTITFMRAAFTAGHTDSGRQALEALEERADEVRTPHLVFHVFHSIAVARLVMNDPDGALIPAARARSIARQIGDITGEWQAARVRASAATMAGRHKAESAHHEQTADLAGRVADDLFTDPSTRSEATYSELESRALLCVHAYEAGFMADARKHAELTLERVRRARASGDADPQSLEAYRAQARELLGSLALQSRPRGGRKQAGA